MTSSNVSGRSPFWVGFVALGAAFAADFYFDVRERDLYSWMDPYQYFDFGVGVLEGTEAFDRFEIPSIFPFFVMPWLVVDPSVSSALWINVASMLLLLVGVHMLCRELDLRTPSLVVGLLVLSSPLLLGLSRTLYSEFTLAAQMVLVFALWLRFLKQTDLQSGLWFGTAFTVAFMTKLTLPVFMIAPVAGSGAAPA